MVKNEYGVSEISISSTAKCFCPLGQDWYTNQFKIMFAPGEYIPDYCELDHWLARHINGKELIIEAAVAKLFEHVQNEYSPRYLRVVSEVEDARHSAVIIERCS